MPPLTSQTITRLDPGLPLLWRDEHTLQLGTDGTLCIPADAQWVELLLSRMRAGFRRHAFDVIAHGVGAPRQAARDLLARLAPLLIDDPTASVAVWVESVNITDGRVSYRMREALEDERIAEGSRSRPSDVGVILVQGAAAALQFACYLRNDISHLPVAFERGRATVGPLVIPGLTPCLACRDEHDRDRDAAWPRLHSQLVARDPGPISAALVAEAATLAARILRSPAYGSGEVATLSADGTREWTSVSFHEECRCRELSFPSQPGTVTERAPHDRPTSTRTATTYARPA